VVISPTSLKMLTGHGRSPVGCRRSQLRLVCISGSTRGLA
jgi:hypothetical protein